MVRDKSDFDEMFDPQGIRLPFLAKNFSLGILGGHLELKKENTYISETVQDRVIWRKF